MPKRPCTQRAEWRLLRGKPSQHLSANYQLDCDYGTALVAIYKEGEGDDPIYLCESHATEVRNAGERRVSIRAVEAPAPASQETAPASEPQTTESDVPAIIPTSSAIISATTPTPTAALEAAISIIAATPNDDDQPPAPVIAESKPIPPAIPDALPISAATPATTFADSPSNTSATPPASASTVAPPNASSGASAAASINTPAVAPIARSVRAAVSTFARGFARDLTYGDAAKALVDEAIWNMEPGAYDIYWTALRQGKPAAEAAQAAGGQLAIVHRRIGEYTAKIEGVLSKSTARISVEGAIDKPLEQATLEIIASALADTEKDAAIDQLGTLQEWMKRGLDREMTPLQAHQIARSIGDRANWGATADLPEELKPAYRALYGSVRTALRAAVPHANNLDERLTNLFAAKSDLENVPIAKTLLHVVTT